MNAAWGHAAYNRAPLLLWAACPHAADCR